MMTANPGAAPQRGPDPALASEMAAIGQRARAAAAALALAPAADQELRRCAPRRRACAPAQPRSSPPTARDLAEAAGDGLAPALRDRLALDPKRLAAIAARLEAIAELPDPVGRALARLDAAERARHRAGRGAARRHRHHL